MRYWNGEEWEDQFAPTAAVQASTEAVRKPSGEEPSLSLLLTGLIFAFLMPIIGFVIGLVVLARGSARGVGIMALSILAGVFWYNQILQDTEPIYTPEYIETPTY